MTDSFAALTMTEHSPDAPADEADRISLAHRTVSGGFFARRRGTPGRSPFIPAGMVSGEPYRHCFTYEGGGSTIHRELIDMIDGARRKIFIAALTLGDKDLRESLIHAAGRLRGGVYVVSALDDKGLQEAINEYDDNPDIDAQLEHRNFRELTKHGIYVRGYRGLHAKFVVVDDQIALVSSANLVTASFTATGENGVVVTHPADVETLARVFTRLWQLSQWDMPPDARHPGVIDKRAPSTRMPPPLAAAEGTGPIWTWENAEADHHIARTVADIASTARTDLILATFSIAGISYELPKTRPRPELLLEPVQRTAQRGARIRLLMRGRNFLPAARAEATAFAEAGAQIVPDQKNHAKGVIADRERGALFSANFTVPRGLTGGVEMGMRLDGTVALTDAHRYFEHVMAEANMEFLRDPALGDLADTLYADSMTSWPLPKTITVTADDDVWESLAAGRGVVAYERASDETVTLYSGRRAWSLRQAGDTWALARKNENGTTRRNAADIFEAWLTGKNPQGIQRGLCPATLVRVAARTSGSEPLSKDSRSE
jgi:phosphatidylserine/phosphatidylglycerophosphate/cardiolipin synthase-like enzyme